MNVHIALYNWKPDVTSTEVVQALVKVESLVDKISGIVEISTTENKSK